jgi:hypothetical protein
MMLRLDVTNPDTDRKGRSLDNLIPLRGDTVRFAAPRLDTRVIVNDPDANPTVATNCRAEGRKR